MLVREFRQTLRAVEKVMVAVLRQVAGKLSSEPGRVFRRDEIDLEPCALEQSAFDLGHTRFRDHVQTVELFELSGTWMQHDGRAHPVEMMDARIEQVHAVACGQKRVAGNETTTHLIGNACLALARGNASMSAPDSASRVERVVEETLRYDPPVQFLMRVTTCETELAGTQLPAGAMVMTLLGATGRDARQHAHPHRFDSNRASSTHLAFGVGPHACPGASLARMEARVALNRAIRAVPKLRLAKRPGAVVRSQSLQLRGLQHLWVEVGR